MRVGAGPQRARQGSACIAEPLAREQPLNVPYQENLARVYETLAQLQEAKGEIEKALEYCDKRLAVSESLAQAHPSVGRTAAGRRRHRARRRRAGGACPVRSPAQQPHAPGRRHLRLSRAGLRERDLKNRAADADKCVTRELEA